LLVSAGVGHGWIIRPSEAQLAEPRLTKCLGWR
jgi:hypothetical protein